MAHRYDICAECQFGDGSAEWVCDACDEGDQFEEGDEIFEDPEETEDVRRFIPILEAA